MAAIAATTRRIRVGSAGVMLPHYSALKVAEQFRVLEAHRARPHRPRPRPRAGLRPADRAGAQSARERRRRLPAPGRRAACTGSRAARCPTSIRSRAIGAFPQGPTSPEIWILGSSNYGAQLAAHLGLPYAYAYFFTDGVGRRGGARDLPALLPPERALPRAAGDDLRVGARRRHRRARRGSCSRRASTGAWASSGACACRWSRPRQPRRASLRRRRPRAHRGAAPARVRRNRRRRRREAARARRRARARRARRQHLDVRPRGAAALLRAPLRRQRALRPSAQHDHRHAAERERRAGEHAEADAAPRGAARVRLNGKMTSGVDSVMSATIATGA